MKDVVISAIEPSEMCIRAPELAALHQAAFGESDARADQYRSRDIPEMARSRGVHALIARTPSRLVGYVLGYDAIANPVWFEHVSRAVQRTPVAAWLPDAWYLADIAVHPDVQGRGIGTMLHHGIMQLVTGRHSMLITWHGDHPAKRLYLRLGWREVVPDLEYHPGGPRTSLMEFAGIEPDR